MTAFAERQKEKEAKLHLACVVFAQINLGATKKIRLIYMSRIFIISPLSWNILIEWLHLL